MLAQSRASIRPLKVDAGGHYLVNEEGVPFFWLGDTAWKLFANLDEQEAHRYLTDRKQKKFTVIQAHLLDWEFNAANVYGHPPFVDGNINTPDSAYWGHVDFIIDQAEAMGLYMALLPIWARSHIEPQVGGAEGKVLYNDTLAAYHYGKFLGDRYKEKRHIIWILGGDAWGTRDVIYDRLAQGLAAGAAGGKQAALLMSYHPPGGTHRPPATSSGEFYHNKAWLDFNMIQSGHRVDNQNYKTITQDYQRMPIKPTLDSEPCYEQHPVEHKFEKGVFNAWHVRRRAYWSLLAGAFGFTYGANGIWQMDKPGKIFQQSHHNYFWYDALHFEGARDMAYVRALMESRPFLNPERVPDQSIFGVEAGTVDERVQCARAVDGSYWIMYITNGREITADLSKVSGEKCHAGGTIPGWQNVQCCQQAENKPFGKFSTAKAQQFDPPGKTGPGNDWILVLDNAESHYSIPGY